MFSTQRSGFDGLVPYSNMAIFELWKGAIENSVKITKKGVSFKLVVILMKYLAVNWGQMRVSIIQNRTR